MNNKKVIILTIIIILIIILVPLMYKIYKNHQDNLIKVVEEEFLYQAKKCYDADICTNKVYLKDLYTNNYLEDKLTNPLNKKYYSEDSYIDLNTNEIKLF